MKNLSFAVITVSLVVLLSACGGGGGGGGNNTGASSSAKAITAFSLNGVTGTINESAKTIAVTMPYGTNVTELVATFAATGTNVTIGSSDQTSGSTPNDFTSPLAYTVTAADGSKATYTVTVTVALDSAKAITAFSLDGVTGAINESAKTISVTMPYGTDVTSLVAAFTTTGASIRVGSTDQTSGLTPNDFTDPVAYTVTAADDTTATYTVTVTVALNSAKAITAFSLDGVTGTVDESAKTISVIMPYGTDVTSLVATFTTTGASVSVGATEQTSGTTPNNFTALVTYTVTAADSSTATYTVTVTLAFNSAKAITAFSLNGVAGTIDESAKTVSVIMPYGTDVTSLVATFTTTGASVRVGPTDQTSGSTPNDFTNPVAYTVTAANNSTATYTVTVTAALSSAKAITSYSLGGVPGAINEPAKTISVTMPYDVSVCSLVATFTTTGASVRVGSTDQTSGATANDFTSPVTYTVTAADSSTATYIVTVAEAAIRVPKTGQTASYATRDDGNLQKGVAWPNPRFAAFGNNSTVFGNNSTTFGNSDVVTDNLTGLIWAPNANTPTFGPCTGGTKSWQQALDYVVCLNANNYLGYVDWRLPNINELTSLSNAGASSVGWLNTQGFSNVQATWGYWSSTTVRNGTAKAWNVVMDDGSNAGSVRTTDKSYTSYAWPVRRTSLTAVLPKTGQTLCYDSGGAQIPCDGTRQDGDLKLGVAWPDPRFTTNTDGTITDNLTGLVWGPDGGTPTNPGCTGGFQRWQNALDYVACLNTTNYLGHNDWRLPNRNEFNTLVNYSDMYPTGWLYYQGFSNVVQTGWWTSTTSASPTTSAWYFQANMPESTADKSVFYHVWPVRGGR